MDSILYDILVKLKFEKLKDIVPIKSASGNTYMCSLKNKKTFFVHPLILFFFNLQKHSLDIESWYNDINIFPHEIDHLGLFTQEEIVYNMSKYKLMLKEGYFDSYDNQLRISKKITSEQIKTGLANVNHVMLELTDQCNLNCTYCGYGKYYDREFDARSNNYLDSEVAKNFLTNLIDYWNSPLNLSHGKLISICFYGGEPLMNFPLIKELVSYINSRDLKHNIIRFSISTNGVFIDKYLDYFVENQINLAISLDGDQYANSYRKTHNKKESFSKITQNIAMIKKKYPIFFSENISFCSVLHNRNSVDKIHKYFKEEHNKVPHIAELASIGLNKKHQREFEKMFNRLGDNFDPEIKNRIKEQDLFDQSPAINGASTFIHNYNDYCFGNYNDLYFNNQKPIRTPTRTCIPFSKKIFLTVNGKILPCETISHNYFLGNVTRDHFNIDFEAIEKKYELYFEKIKKQCNQCYYVESCHKCIYDFDIDSKSVACDTFMTKEKFSGFLSNHLSYIETNPEMYSKILEETQYE